MRESNALDSTRLQRLQQTPLWDFALSLYAKPGVEAACLTLQDNAGVDVCELLFHCWLYSHGLEAVPAALERERQKRCLWQRRVTTVLRELRRDLKPEAASSEPITALRNTIKQAEIMAERENLQRWQTWVIEAPSDDDRVSNVVDKAQSPAIWLGNKLLIAGVEPPLNLKELREPIIFQALQTLTYELDPCAGAR